jgi:16S rRNA (guanine527-N7)-methyltransferase
LGGKLEERKDFSLPFSDEKRSLLLIKKIAASLKKYPRAVGLPSKEPLA